MLAKDKADKLIEIFIEVDDFCKDLNDWLTSNPQEGFRRPRFEGLMSASEVMTVIIFYQYSGYKCDQYYYHEMVQKDLLEYFPAQVKYKRCLQLISKAPDLMYVFTKWQCTKAEATETYFVDSKKLSCCHNRRISSHKVFRGLAERGKTSTGWFYGSKIHMVVNNLGQCMNFVITPGNISDANPDVLRHIFLKMKGNCYGDKGYLSSIFEELYLQGLKLVTKVRKNMKNRLMPIKRNTNYISEQLLSQYSIF